MDKVKKGGCQRRDEELHGSLPALSFLPPTGLLHSLQIRYVDGEKSIRVRAVFGSVFSFSFLEWLRLSPRTVETRG